jgi:hypothetical protein
LRTTPSCRNGYQKLGQMGKKNLKRILYRSQAVCWLLFAVSASGCAGDLGEHLQSGRVLAWQGLEGRWVGAVAPTESACGPTTQGLMSIGEKGFGFDPFQSTAVIRGTVGDDGRLKGNLERQGPEHRALSIVFEGAAQGKNAISGTLQSGRCRWTVALHRG